MVRTLTEEEAEQQRIVDYKEAIMWLSDLNPEDAALVHNTMGKLIAQRNCSHEFHSIKFYSKSVEICKHCDYQKPE